LTAGIINPANILTSTRLLVLPLIVVSMVIHQPIIGIVVVIYSGLVDIFDGKVARYFNCSTPFGEMLDAVSDASLFLVTMIGAAILGYANPLLVALYLAMGGINALGRVIHIKRSGQVTNFRSYASEVLGGLSFFIMAAVFVDYYVDGAILFAIVLGLIIIIHDYHRILTLGGSKNEPV
jgi:phosphatidylglycerophosphate synthase